MNSQPREEKKKMVDLLYWWGSACSLDANLERDSRHPVASCQSIGTSRICCLCPNTRIFISLLFFWCVEVGDAHMCSHLKAQVEALSCCQNIFVSGFSALLMEFTVTARLAG